MGEIEQVLRIVERPEQRDVRPHGEAARRADGAPSNACPPVVATGPRSAVRLRSGLDGDTAGHRCHETDAQISEVTVAAASPTTKGVDRTPTVSASAPHTGASACEPIPIIAGEMTRPW